MIGTVMEAWKKGRAAPAAQSGDVQWQATDNSCGWYFKNITKFTEQHAGSVF
jgi:hypothetical protein